jgi:hypothetical protein
MLLHHSFAALVCAPLTCLCLLHTIQSGRTALHAAASSSHANVVSALLSHPAVDPNETNNAGLTALTLARVAGHAEVVTVMTSDVRVQRYNHARAPAGDVFRAAKAGDVDVLERYLDAGASTEETDVVSVMHTSVLRQRYRSLTSPRRWIWH